jgi:DNA-binding CsgD family transcriptional regulator
MVAWALPGGILAPASDGGRSTQGGQVNYVALSKRELEVMSLIAEGHTDNVVGEKLGISSSTAHFHALNALKKLRAPNRANAVAKALREGIIL